MKKKQYINICNKKLCLYIFFTSGKINSLRGKMFGASIFILLTLHTVDFARFVITMAYVTLSNHSMSIMLHNIYYIG